MISCCRSECGQNIEFKRENKMNKKCRNNAFGYAKEKDAEQKHDKIKKCKQSSCLISEYRLHVESAVYEEWESVYDSGKE